jgi:hypothetical protein
MSNVITHFMNFTRTESSQGVQTVHGGKQYSSRANLLANDLSGKRLHVYVSHFTLIHIEEFL